MSARRKPMWRWEPAAYIVLFLLLFATSAAQAVSAGLAFWILLALTVAAVLALIVQSVVFAHMPPRNPDGSGNLTTLAHLGLIVVDASNAAPRRVADTQRHQSAIDAAHAFGGGTLRAVLVPHATRWLGRRFRVSVQLISGQRVFHAGFLPMDISDQFNDMLYPLRCRGGYLSVPATVAGEKRPFSVEVDLGGARAAAGIANRQIAPR